MALGHMKSLTLLHRTFRRLPWKSRLHILGRYLTCPFLRTLDVIPRGARVLDIGAGHGTYAGLIAEARDARVIAVEPDLRKALFPIRHPNVQFVASFDDGIRGEFDVIVVYDVIYRLAASERDALFERVRDRLRPGGIFVLKDLDPEHRLKHGWNRLQEKISDRFLGLTIGEGFNIESRGTIERRMRKLGFEEFTAKRVDAGYLHAHILYTARRPVQSRL